MMRARLGIDKTKLWADWAEEEEEAAELTKTLEAATAEHVKIAKQHPYRLAFALTVWDLD